MQIVGRNDEACNKVLDLHASLFGVFELKSSDGSVVIISNRRARAILAMLCLVPEQSFSRRYLSKILWPDRFEAQARASLRQCLSDLGKFLAPLNGMILDVNRSCVSLNAENITTDLFLIENALKQHRYLEAAALIREISNKPVLDQLIFGPEFGLWLKTQRENIDRRLHQAVRSALIKLDQCGDKKTYTQLQAAWECRDPARARKTLTARDETMARIAVLPFEFLGANSDRGYLADGIVDELITSLGRAPELLVAGRTSSFHFKGTKRPLAEIALELGVDHLIEGSIQLQGEDIRVCVRLIKGESGFEVWSQRYDGLADDSFALQDNVSRDVTRELSKVLKRTFDIPSGRELTPNKTAYDLYLQGRALTTRAIGDGVLDTAIALLEKSLVLDPDFAECWTALAEAHVYKSVYTPCLDRLTECEKMAEHARRAIFLAPDQGHARAMLGILKWTKNDIVGALDLAFEAYRLEPTNPDVVIRLGSFLLYCGRTRQALPYIEAAIDQDPINARNYAMLTTARLNVGDIDGSIAAGERMRELGFPAMWLAVATAASGDTERAVQQYRSTRQLMNTVIFPPAGSTPMSPDAMDAYWLMAAKGVCSGKAQDRDIYCNMLNMLHATLHDKYDPTIVLPAIWMGYTEMVFKTLGERITPANFFGFMQIWSEREPVRQIWTHPNFMTFSKNIGMVKAWEKYGWPDLLPRPTSID
jgi:TolB-like protein/DNA-binding SARP family transcriptional activator